MDLISDLHLTCDQQSALTFSKENTGLNKKKRYENPVYTHHVIKPANTLKLYEKSRSLDWVDETF